MSSEFSRRDFLRYSGATGAAAIIASTLAACSGGPASTGSVGAGSNKDLITAVIGYGNDQSWDPTQTASAFAMAGINHIYEGLLDTDPITREPYAALATALPTDANATAWTFTLREGAKWHDGKPVTADDVVFTFERILDPEANVLVGNFFRSWLREVKKVDDRTVELVFKFAFPDAAPRLTIAKIMPKHVFGQQGALGRRPRAARPSARDRTSWSSTTPSPTPPSRRSRTTTGRARPRSRR